MPKTSNYEPQVKPLWWRDNEYCEFHKGRGYKTNNCHRLKDIIQDLVDWGEIEVDGYNKKTSNKDHTMLKNPLLSYEKGGPSHQGKNQDITTNYTHASYDYTVNNLNDANEKIATITIKGKDPKCNVVTHHNNITLLGAPSRLTYVPKKYNLVDQLDKTPTLISIL